MKTIRANLTETEVQVAVANYCLMKHGIDRKIFQATVRTMMTMKTDDGRTVFVNNVADCRVEIDLPEPGDPVSDSSSPG